MGDKGYSSRKAGRYLQRRGIGAVVPRRMHKRRSSLNKERHRERNRVERLINRLKQFRCVDTRYEKLAANYLTMLTIAAIVLWLGDLAPTLRSVSPADQWCSAGGGGISR